MPNLNLTQDDILRAHGIGVQVFEIPETIPEPPVPADTYTTLLHSYEYLSAQMGPLYRALRDMEQKRDRWRTLTIVLIIGWLLTAWWVAVSR